MAGLPWDKNLNTEWEKLCKTIFRRYQREENSDGFDISRPNENLARAFLRLLPIAHLLQQNTNLHHLMPWQHHGVLDLFLINRKRLIIRILPQSENTYRVSFFDPKSTLGYAQVRPYREIRDVLLGKVLSLIQEELTIIEAIVSENLPDNRSPEPI